MAGVTPIKSPVIGTILRLSFVIGIAFLPGLYATGQVKFSTVVSSQDLGKSDYLQVEFIVENAKQIDDLTPPDFPGFHVIQGPIQSSGMSIINGNMSQYKGLSFVLEPTKTGKFTIGGAVATVDGKQMRSNTVTVSVHPGGSGSANSNGPPGGGNPFGGNPFGGGSFFPPSMADPFGRAPGEIDRDYVLKPGENVKEKIRKNLFVRVQVDKKSCYVGEPIVATYKLYTRLNSESRVTKNPSLNGFSVYDMIEPGADNATVEKLNGKAYSVHTIRKTQLIPLQAGTVDLDPAEVENTVHFVKGNGRMPVHSGNSIQDLIDQMSDEGNMGPEVNENVTLDTKPLPITIKPLPDAGKPATFNGAVGNFSIEASLNNKSVAAEDEATLHVVVRGKGNLPVIAAPVVNWPSAIEAFDPTAKEEINKTVAPMSGYKSFDYVFTPRTAGHYTIPAVDFPYFDPASQTYKTAETQPLDIQVTPAAHTHQKPAGAVVAQSAVPAASNDILSIARDHWKWIVASLVLAMVAFYFWGQNRRLKKLSLAKVAADKKEKPTVTQWNERPRDNMPGPISSAADVRPGVAADAHPPVAGATTAAYVPAAPVIDPLLEARQAFEQGDSKSFYGEVNRAIWKSMSKKLDLPASELNKQNVIRQLRLRGWDDTSLLSLENILNECEMNLYTPAYDRWNMQQLLNQAQWVMERMN